MGEAVRRRIARGEFLKASGGAFAGAWVLGLAGCGAPEGSSETGGSDSPGLVVGYDQEPPSLNQYISDHVASYDMAAPVVEAPLQVQPDLTFAPRLAADQPVIAGEDPFVVEYGLREEARWSDGEPVTSADARWTFEQIMDPDNLITSREGWDKIEGFETPDERTVRMTFSEAYANWRTLLTGPLFPRHVYEGKNFNEALSNEIVGSGPYRLEEWRKGESLTLEANENYWGERPGIQKVIFRFIPDTNTLITSLQSGEVSFIRPPPDVGLIERLSGIEGAIVESKAGTVWEHIAFNLEKVPDHALRQAIAYGINREQVVNELLSGQVNPLDSVLVPDQEPYYTPAWGRYDHDPDRARRLAQEARGNGADTAITFSTTAGNRLRETLQQIVQQQLKNIGITVEIKNSAAQTLVNDLNEGNYEMSEFAWFQTPEPSITSIFSKKYLPPDGDNSYRYVNDEVTRLLEQSDLTVDRGRRAELFERAQEQMAEDLPLIPMYQRPDIYAYSEDLRGPEVNPTLAGPFWNIGEWSLP